MILFYAPQYQALAKKTMECLRTHKEALFPHAYPELTLRLGEIDWNSFRDRTPDLFIHDVEHIRGEDVAFLANLSSPRNHPPSIFEQLAVMYALPRYLAASVRIILPFFPFGTMERVDRPGQIATAMTAARMLGAIPPAHQGGNALITTYDIHALPEQFFFPDSVTPNLRSAHQLIRERLAQDGGPKKYTICFPDEGAFKRFGRDWGDYLQIICGKRRRKGDERAVVLQEGEPAGTHVVIVDDLIQSGGTAIACKNVLMTEGAQDVSLYATHGVCPEGASTRLMNAGFANVWLTDSCSSPMSLEAETLSLAPLIAEDLCW